MFETVAPMPPDPILGLSQKIRNDPRPEKVDLGVGVFRTADGATPVMKAVAEAQRRLVAHEQTKAYTAPEGAPGFGDALLKLVFGADNDALAAGRCAAVQAPGGCGALRLIGELHHRFAPGAVAIGAPTWANHEPLLTASGNRLKMAPYYDPATSTLLYQDFLTAIESLDRGDSLLLHGACHNPTGADLAKDQIDEVLEIVRDKGLFLIIDTAYHGFAKDLDHDAYLIRAAAARLPELLVSYSCSKNFGLYRERTGALIIVGQDRKSAEAVKSHALNIARESWSMPPAHGGVLVSSILQSEELTALWREELASMTAAVKQSRTHLKQAASKAGLGNRLSFIEDQNGMFSMLPVTPGAVETLQSDFGVYMVGNGRINLCGVHAGNAAYIAEALSTVL